MKRILLFSLILLSNVAWCQTTFNVQDFSDDYYGKILIEDTTEVFSKGWVAIYDKKTNVELIKVESDELTYELHNGSVLANIKELPYGEQSQILYDDYNFDGIKDFAIMDGQNSCYHGPSFQIYLATKDGFILNTEFTALAQEYCGMFEVDHEEQVIRTMVKSGCCWHQYTAFKVKNNSPYAIHIVEEGLTASGTSWEIVEESLINDKMVKSSYQLLALEITEDNLLLSFEFENKKKMQILSSENKLYYVFTDADGKIELLYEDEFKYSQNDNCLTFSNNNTLYKIYNQKIIVKEANKEFEMNAKQNTQIGSLSKLKELSIENVKI